MFAAVLAVSLGCTAAAQPSAGEPMLDHPDAFERAFAVSSYLFDACGDPLAGRTFRRALTEQFAQCPFTPEARSRFQRRTRAQLAKSRQQMEGMIESRGGLPMRLDGMTMTCREQQGSDGYKQLRERLDRYSRGDLTAQAIIAAPCDAPDITP